jgi:hypothetical protein
MSTVGSSAARILLFAILALSAGLKIKHFLVARDWTPENPLLAVPVFLYAVIAFELGLACLLATPWFRAASVGCALLALGGVLVHLYGHVAGVPVSCGCLGRIPLTTAQHLALSAAVVFLATRANKDRRGASFGTQRR